MTDVQTPLMRIKHQTRVRDFLALSCQEGHLSHAYLFVGAPGAGKHEMARALAQMVVCPNGGDGSCDDCIRVAHRTHPDVHELEPGGVDGYLIDQIRDLINDSQHTPVRSRTKVYILGACERLRGRPANALLKTIEEPPANALFILIARSVDTVLPTLVSRCQQVPFRVLSSAEAIASVREATGASETDARIALSVCHAPGRAESFIESPGRRALRKLVVDTVLSLTDADLWDVLCAAREIAEKVSAPFAEEREHGEAISKDEAEYLTSAALKKLEQAMRRDLSARERMAVLEVVDAASSVLADVSELALGRKDALVNLDVVEGIERLASHTTVSGTIAALQACKRGRADIARNVTPQVALEVMLLCVKEALSCQE